MPLDTSEKEHFGDVPLDGFNLLALAAFEGNICKTSLGLFINERADERLRQALQMIYAGHGRALCRT